MSRCVRIGEEESMRWMYIIKIEGREGGRRKKKRRKEVEAHHGFID
jgi:hypothetical protein